MNILVIEDERNLADAVCHILQDAGFHAEAVYDGRYIELVGRYNPLTNPKTIELDLEKVDSWIAKGAQPTNAVSHLIDIARGDAPEPEKKAKKSKKQIAKDAETAEAAAAESAE